MALYYAGLIGPCSEAVVRAGEPPELSEQLTWRYLKMRELQLACRIWLGPSEVDPSEIESLFSDGSRLLETEDMTVPEELLLAFLHHLRDGVGDHADALCALVRVFAAESKKIGIGPSFDHEIDDVVAALCGSGL